MKCPLFWDDVVGPVLIRPSAQNARTTHQERKARGEPSRFVGNKGNILIGADFQEGEEDSNFSVFRVQRFTEWPEPLH